ncbi:PREDICTED: trypsin-1-like [Nicrophorus vespilloides]|uniref:Trypsin-1-like n=1 Tax=Nicrophorus vespilloides TaxID=110193 RepID=A0ABM1M4I4_NICVS|nr:PREDICTED: trypsin-1-like [Nicrophorus vespilloides]
MFLKVALFTALVASVSAFRPRLDGRIVGGHDSNIVDFPYQLSLCYNGGHICGAVLISTKFAITAAHCTNGLPSHEPLTIRAGHSRLNEGFEVNISNIIQNPQFDPMYLDYDITVIELAEYLPVTPEVIPISMASADYPEDYEAIVSGWGALSETGTILSPILQSVSVKIMSRENCSKIFAGITERMVCAGAMEGGKDACQGDSGGPIVANGQLIGLVSWGYGCARPGYPGVYSNVASMRDFIGQNTGV